MKIYTKVDLASKSGPIKKMKALDYSNYGLFFDSTSFRGYGRNLQTFCLVFWSIFRQEKILLIFFALIHSSVTLLSLSSIALVKISGLFYPKIAKFRQCTYISSGTYSKSSM